MEKRIDMETGVVQLLICGWCLQVMRVKVWDMRALVGAAEVSVQSRDIFGEHRWADSFVACACFYIAEDMEYSEAHFYWPG